ncbi:site-specific integrase [Streptomyces longwoodensis]|uniref:tyrosine-type recombinase/integrase n=1 Tax=Streptomyces longwoodensis TaxID=68231 RepID=UPI002DD86C8A|nr:site-specific integrase [Streptomyces longwoodensis]WRY88772.1 site-specific integrase [Streptomyces longwoodensis]
MASIVERPKKAGPPTYQVKWRQDGAWQSENFGGEEGAAQAEQFKALVEAHGNRWPYGWIRGKGFVEPEEHPNDQLLVDYAKRYVDRLTGVDVRTREDYHREIRLHFGHLVHTRTDGLEVPATICNVTQDDVTDWVRREQEGERDPQDAGKWLRRKADPKSISNRHGLMYCVFQAAMDATPQLRTTNPCKRTKLPRQDDHVDQDMCFLERDEYARIALEIKDPDARDLADFLVGTGMRWSEATALKVKDISLTDRPTASVQRAWKRAQKGAPAGEGFFLGPPKTKKARRLIALSPAQAETCRRLVAGHGPEDFVFRAAKGGPWRHSNFYHRKWQPAVKAAVEAGLPKAPRLHDLRHTHVAWLIAADIPLPAIQARLGHESIQTTVDRYGHLVRELDDKITAAVQGIMAVPAPRAGLRAV